MLDLVLTKNAIDAEASHIAKHYGKRSFEVAGGGLVAWQCGHASSLPSMAAWHSQIAAECSSMRARDSNALCFVPMWLEVDGKAWVKLFDA